MLVSVESDSHRTGTAPATGPSQYARVVQRASVAYVPLNVLIELTHRCHLDCVHCYLEDNHAHEAGSRELKTEELIRLIDELTDAGCLFLTLSGGEIFLRRDTVHVARYARSRGLAIRFFTAGLLLTPELIDSIAELHPLSVEFSLYSAENPGLHDAITRVPGSHAKTLWALRELTARRIPVVIKTPLMRSVFQEYPGIIALARTLGAAYLLDPTVTPKNDGNLSTCALRVTPDQLAELYADPTLPVVDEIKTLASRQRLRDPDDEVCNLGKMGCAISPFGDVYPTLGFPWAAGNVRERPFQAIWKESPVFVKLRDLKIKDLGVCSGCEKSTYCNRCCMWALMDDGDFLGGSTWACGIAAAKERAAGLPSKPTPHQVKLGQQAGAELSIPLHVMF
ncbi:MAG TPA: radical SAM protein [Nitrospiria bacterium]|nr:radical SAM protein [Nitrospiria bacterium]